MALKAYAPLECKDRTTGRYYTRERRRGEVWASAKATDIERYGIWNSDIGKTHEGCRPRQNRIF